MRSGFQEIAAFSSALVLTGYMLYKYHQARPRKEKPEEPEKQVSKGQQEEGTGAFDIERMRALIPQRRLGTGSFGTVSLMTCGTTGEHFALKSVNYPTTSSNRDREERQRARIEAKVGIRVATENRYLLPCRAAWRDDTKAYILSPLCHGRSLESFFPEQRPCDGLTCRLLLAELVSAVCCLHEHEVCHRDIKLENMLVTREGHIKVADFGGCEFIRRGKKVTSYVGTLPYMVICATAGAALPSDVWSIGVVLYRLLTGFFPFQHRGFHLMALQIQSGQWQHTGVDALDADPPALNLMDAIFQVNPKDRPTVHQLRRHPFFDGMDWDIVNAGELANPIPLGVVERTSLRPRHVYLLPQVPDVMKGTVVGVLGVSKGQGRSSAMVSVLWTFLEGPRTCLGGPHMHLRWLGQMQQHRNLQSQFPRHYLDYGPERIRINLVEGSNPLYGMLEHSTQ